MPDVRAEISGVWEEVSALRDDMLTHFDAIYRRFEKLETEYEALRAAVGRQGSEFSPPASS